MRLSSRKIQDPKVDLHVSGQPGQSASAYATRSREEHRDRCRPKEGVPRMYLSIRLMRAKWGSRGSCMYIYSYKKELSLPSNALLHLPLHNI
jgi:hypothetical protein